MTVPHLFLTGPSGAGKTTCILEELAPYRKYCGGFLSQRLVDENGETKGFRLVSLMDSGKMLQSVRLYEPGLSNVFIRRIGNKTEINTEVFRTAGKKIIDDVLHSFNQDRLLKFCLLDELGGVELREPEFMDAVYRLLDSGIPCIGVLKSRKNLHSMGTRMALGGEMPNLREEFETRLIDQFKCRLMVCHRAMSREAGMSQEAHIQQQTNMEYETYIRQEVRAFLNQWNINTEL